MTHKVSRRTVLKTVGTAVSAGAVLSAGIMPVIAQPSKSACTHDHKTWGYQLGALMVDPSLSQAEKDVLLASAVCLDCGTQIEPDGLSYSEHMPAKT